MKKLSRAIFIITVLCCVAVVLVSCNKPVEESESSSVLYSEASAGPMNCVIVYSNHANSLAGLSGVEQYVRGTKEANGYLGFVRLDGEPAVTYSEQTITEHNNTTNINRENDKFVTEKMGMLEEITAKEAEVDIMASVKEASRCLNQAEDETIDNVVVIVGTGLSTTGVVDFATNIPSSIDLNDYESWIEESGQLPKLDNITKIIWIGFDRVGEPQSEFPSEEFQDSLKNFYTTLFEAAGVGSVEFVDQNTEDNSLVNSDGESNVDLPSVSLVTLPEKPEYGAGDMVEISAEVLFNPDQATFLNGANPSNNEEIIAIANSLKSGKLNVTITGYTAHYSTSSGCESLSLQRAEALKSVLVEMGCPEDSITTVGGGWGPYGEGSAEIDQQNRCVQFEFE
jgi:OmpA-OmpF porin, OOP family